jgi:hypothetical protein
MGAAVGFVGADGFGRTVSPSDPLPVDIQGATLSLDAAGIEIKNDSGNPIPVDDAGGSLTVDGPLTDAELRADPVPVSGPLTDAELRASAVPTVVPARTPTTTSVASSASSVTILAANSSRKGFSISNVSTAKLYLSFTNPATTTNAWIEVPAGAFLLLDQQLIVGNAIYGIWTSTNGTAQVTEYV